MAVNTKFAQKSFLSLPPWAKGVVAIAVVGGIGYAVYKLSQLKQTDDEKSDKDEANYQA